MSFLGIDIGTTGCKAIVYSKYGDILVSEYREYPLIHPNPGWNELDPLQIISFIKNAIKTANQKLKKDKIRAFAVSCQGEAVIPVNKEGQCLYNAIVTFDARTQQQHDFWERTLGREAIFKITGMPLHPMYSINKIMWFKKNRKDLFRKTYRFLCFEDFLQFKFGLNPCISYSLAARTAAFDVVKKQWSEKILSEAKIDIAMLSRPLEAGQIAGVLNPKMCNELGFENDVICAGGGHDQACGAFGCGIYSEGIAMNASGTSDASIIMLDRPNLNDLLLKDNYPCAPYVIPDKYTILTFNLSGGLLLRWFKENFCREEITKAQNEGRSPYEVIDAILYDRPVDIFILPHFVGSGTPLMDANSKGIIMGLDIEADKPKIARAILESNAYDLKLNIEKLENVGAKITKVIAIGGGARSSAWMQIKADIVNKEFITLKNSETACLGAALLAGIASGHFSDYTRASQSAVAVKKIFHPRNNSGKLYNQRYDIYKNIYSANKDLLHKIKKLSEEPEPV